MGKNRAMGTILALSATALIVVASAFWPGQLMLRKESGLLGEASYVTPGYYYSHAFPENTVNPEMTAPVTATPTGNVWLGDMDELVRKITLYEQGKNYLLPNDSGEGEITMKAAILASLTEVEYLVKSGVILPLANFPVEYSMEATLNTAVGKDKDSFDYWMITFSSNEEQVSQGSISLMLDAQTGKIYHVKMYVLADSESINVDEAVQKLADYLAVPGKALSFKPEEEVSRAQWISNDKRLRISIDTSNSKGGSGLSYYISTLAQEMEPDYLP